MIFKDYYKILGLENNRVDILVNNAGIVYLYMQIHLCKACGKYNGRQVIKVDEETK